MQRVQVKKSDSNATLNDDVSERRVSKAFMQMLDTNATKIQRWFRKTRKPRPIKLTPLERRLQRARETREMLLREMQLTTKVEEPCVYEDDFEDLSQASIEEALSQTRLEPRLDPVLQTSGEEKQDRHLYQDTFKTVSDTVVERHLSQERLETISDTVVDKHLTQNTLSALEPSVPELLVSKPVTQKPKESKSTLKSSQLNGRVNPESRVEENPKSAAIYRSKPSAKPSTKPAVVRKSASAVIKPSEPKPVKKPAKSMEKLVEKPSAISVSPVILSPVAHKSALSEMDNPPVSPLRDAPELGSQEFSTEPRSQEIVRDIGSQEVVEDLESSQLDRNPVKDQETVPQAIEKETSDAEDMDALNQTLMEMEQLQLNNHQTLQDKSSPVPSLGKFSVHVDDASETASTVSYKRSEKSAPRSIHLSKPPSVDITPRESKGTKPPQRYIGSAASESHYSSHYQDSNHTDETSKRVERILDLLKSAEQTQVPELQKPVNVDYLLQEKPPGSDVFEGVKQKLMTQQMELEDKNQIIQTLHLKIEKLKSNQHEMQSAQ
ncbi:hypothetical protein EDD86DRAFT_216210 [Gorgonomyces haynaldii]|nr:hypothetical protein EDD86DRAFT_216210 [Gorgonomyces haynaldii]